jgi:phosphohistidine phosphatase SixA
MHPQHFTRAGTKSALAMLLLLPGFLVTEPARAAADRPAMVVLVRHADKAATPKDDPQLTPAGAQRAQDLKAVLAGANLTAIITTQWRRTKETAQPTADAFGLTPEQVELDPKKPESTHIAALLESLKKRGGGLVLVVGHNNTVPGLIEALGGPRLQLICDSVYDRLFVLVLSSAKPALVQSRYGAFTPEKGCE